MSSLNTKMFNWFRNWKADFLQILGVGAAAEYVLMKDSDGNKMYCRGTTVPSDATAGYSKGCIFVKTDAGAGSSGIYENVGTTTSCNFDAISAAAATAWDAIADPSGAGTVAFGTTAQAITAAKTDGDMLTISGIGNFGDVSVVKIESKTGNPTNGTVLEVVSHDANVDPLVVSTSAQAGTFVVGQDGVVTSVGQVNATAGVKLGSAIQKTDIVSLSNAEIKALRGSPKTLVAAPAAGSWLELVSCYLHLDYGSEAMTESSDNLVIEYATSGNDATAAIDMTGFIDATADTMMLILPAATASGVAAANLIENALQLKNTGDGEFAGNASEDTTMKAIVTYRVHSLT